MFRCFLCFSSLSKYLDLFQLNSLCISENDDNDNNIETNNAIRKNNENRREFFLEKSRRRRNYNESDEVREEKKINRIEKVWFETEQFEFRVRRLVFFPFFVWFALHKNEHKKLSILVCAWANPIQIFSIGKIKSNARGRHTKTTRKKIFVSVCVGVPMSNANFFVSINEQLKQYKEIEKEKKGAKQRN